MGDAALERAQGHERAQVDLQRHHRLGHLAPDAGEHRLRPEQAQRRGGVEQRGEGESGIQIIGQVASGQEALRALRTVTPDLVILDMLMSGMNGLETTRHIMAARASPSLLISGLVERQATLGSEALSAGALDIMRKPTAAELRSGEARRTLVNKIR